MVNIDLAYHARRLVWIESFAAAWVQKIMYMLLGVYHTLATH